MVICRKTLLIVFFLWVNHTSLFILHWLSNVKTMKWDNRGKKDKKHSNLHVKHEESDQQLAAAYYFSLEENSGALQVATQPVGKAPWTYWFPKRNAGHSAWATFHGIAQSTSRQSAGSKLAGCRSTGHWSCCLSSLGNSEQISGLSSAVLTTGCNTCSYVPFQQTAAALVSPRWAPCTWF